MFKIKRKADKARYGRKKLTVTLTSDSKYIDIDYNPRFPPTVFFDTNVIRGLNKTDIDALQQLQASRGFRYHYSMVAFVELASHLGDLPSKHSPNPFRKFQSAFQKLDRLFDGALPSVEMVLMNAVGLRHWLDPKWAVDQDSIEYQVRLIANAKDLKDVTRRGIDPRHYKKLRESDGRSFINLIEKAKSVIEDVRKDDKETTKWMFLVYNFLIYRASSRRVNLNNLKQSEQQRVIKFFNKQGGRMFLSHLLKLLIKTINDGAREDANDFYDMLQLILLRDENLLFVTEDRPFFQYYVGPYHHRVVPWSMFKAS